MNFKLRILGRDYIEAANTANRAVPLIQITPNSGFAELAANDLPNLAPTVETISGLAGLAQAAVNRSCRDATVKRNAIISTDCVPYCQADEMAGLPTWPEAQIALFQKRQAGISWLGYGKSANRLAEILRLRVNDERRLCIECTHARPAWRCAKNDTFMLDQLQRCPSFKEITS